MTAPIRPAQPEDGEVLRQIERLAGCSPPVIRAPGVGHHQRRRRRARRRGPHHIFFGHHHRFAARRRYRGIRHPL